MGVSKAEFHTAPCQTLTAFTLIKTFQTVPTISVSGLLTDADDRNWPLTRGFLLCRSTSHGDCQPKLVTTSFWMEQRQLKNLLICLAYAQY